MGMREFQARMRALDEIKQSEVGTPAQKAVVAKHGSDYSVLQIALKNDVNKIRALPTLEMRAEEKRSKFLPHWLPFVEDYFKKGEIYQNDIVGYCIVYLFDVGNFDSALSLAEKAIKQGQSLPDGFASTLPHFVADQIYKWTDKTATAGQSVEPYFTQTLQNVAMSWQLHEMVTAKWFKLAAALLLRNELGRVHAASVSDPMRLILAIQLCVRAFQLHHKVGVKNMVERCVMRLNALQQTGDYIPEKFPRWLV
ncbi:terminase endonuclease subunit [Actinobacillus genomosp. 2]|uniref:phage terminase small subunit n=1 Tax=Actinobacillus genomosp. 2 TaxID=230709 RepID=UPI00244214A5|nr:terminase endonuclease subunit [Actinobacillus genomosp. 2]WGE32546.1 terminase endonuclease subunit [Actinobacillus genomosp. 2]